MNASSLDHDKQIDTKVQIILRQTDYTEEKAREKLQQFNNNEIAVIKDYFGIAEKKAPPVRSVNQEIYKQLRSHLDSSMKDYRERVEKGEVKKIV
jgi:hypothetical protein